MMGTLASVSPIGWCVLAGVVSAAASIVWTGLRAGIAPMPSSRSACRAMIDAAQGMPDGPVVDLGSGWGTLGVAFARAFPHRTVIGYEVSFVPWLAATLAARCLRLRNLTFRRQDFRTAELDRAAVMLCYLFRDGMSQLADRLGESHRPVCVISNTFALPAHQASSVTQLADLHRTRIYLYRLGGA